MTEVGKTILVERKFSIYTTFLDVVLQSEGIIKEGESRKDALLRVHRELEETAAELRLRNNPDSAWVPGTEFPEHMKTKIEFGPPPIIDKSFERLEIAIDNATTLEELTSYKESASQNKELMSLYMQKLKQLSNANS